MVLMVGVKFGGIEFADHVVALFLVFFFFCTVKRKKTILEVVLGGGATQSRTTYSS